ncbi:unnamed protein product [Sphenostylis stenocarpa]|uniref:Uncharacterized protein n=1 Tax=Sphenostylis stenocarpa TaxID=92480 RepID=A0AA86V7F3_9FABA|nr:unnamed protein product [Sphenostylis stenocarpa]
MVAEAANVEANLREEIWRMRGEGRKRGEVRMKSANMEADLREEIWGMRGEGRKRGEIEICEHGGRSKRGDLENERNSLRASCTDELQLVLLGRVYPSHSSMKTVAPYG